MSLRLGALVVEDETSVRKSILMLLDADGFRPKAFPSAEALLKAMVVATAACLLVWYSL